MATRVKRRKELTGECDILVEQTVRFTSALFTIRAVFHGVRARRAHLIITYAGEMPALPGCRVRARQPCTMWARRPRTQCRART